MFEQKGGPDGGRVSLFRTDGTPFPGSPFHGGGLQMQTHLAISLTGDVWMMDNRQTIASCYGDPVEALSTNCGGQGITIFHGMAKPVRAPQIGPVRPL